MDKIILSEEIINKLKILYRNSTLFLDSSMYKKIEENLLSQKELYELLNIIRDSLISNNKIKLIDFDEELIKKYNNLFSEFEKIKEDILSNIDNFINLAYLVFDSRKKIYLLRELINVKEDILIDMKYYKNEEEINKFSNEYDIAIKNKDIDRMKKLLDLKNTEILKEWEKLDKNIEDMNDNDFCFIGHSTSSINITNKFKGNFISCSLYNQDINDTYRNLFGFIFKPKNIIAAKSKDMFVNNYALDSEDIIKYTSVNIINHPNRILDECIKLKEDNLKNNNLRKVFSEIVLDKFEPIGIFCFTNGSLEYDYNYREVFNLQKSFPSLKIKIFDTMKLKKDKLLDNEKINILNSIESTKNVLHDSYNEKSLLRYEKFFNEFNKLKQKNNYTKKDIEKIYELNKKLLNNTKLEELFSKYSLEDIKYILGRGYEYNIDYILNGDISINNLSNLKKLLPYKNELDKYYPGLEKVVSILPKVSINEEVINEIKKEQKIDLDKIYKILYKYLLINLEDKNNKINSELIELYSKYNELKVKDQNQKIYKEYQNIYLNEVWFKYIKEEYDLLKKEEKENINKEKKLLFNKTEINKRINIMETRISFLESSKYEESDEAKLVLNNIDKLNNDKLVFKKHPILNRKKIKNIDNTINKLEIRNKKEEEKYYNKNKDELMKLYFELEVLKSTLNDIKYDLDELLFNKNEINRQFDNINNKLNELYKCSEIDKIEYLIEEAKKYVSNNKIEYDYNIEIKIEEIKQQIISLENNISEIKEEKSLFSR